MKTFTQITKFIIIFSIALLIYGCPVFKSIKYPKTVYLGDTVSVHVNIDLMGITTYDVATLQIFLPEGWQLTDTVIKLNGLSNSTATFTKDSNNGDTCLSTQVSDEIISDNVLFNLELLNTKSTASVDTFQISFSDEMIFQCDQKFAIRSITDENVPTQLIYNNDTLEWNIPKNNTNTKGYLVTDNADSWFTTGTKVSVDPGSELHRYSVSAVTNNDQEYALNDTVFIFHGDSLFVSESGNDSDPGTETNPLKSLALALDVIDEDYALSKDKSIRLLDGTYILESGVQLRDRVSLIGNGPQNSIISCTSDSVAISSPNLNIGFSLENLSIYAQQNEVILDFVSYYFDVPEIRLSHVQLYNAGHTSNGLRTNFAKLILDHIVVADMDSIGVEGATIQVNNSVFVENNIGIYSAMSELVFVNDKIVNSIFFENQKSIYPYHGTTEWGYGIFIDNTIIEPGWLNNGKGNFYNDPLFIDDPNYPYLLDPNSPAVDAAIDSAKYNDPASLENELLAEFPARGTIRGDLGIYGGGGTDFVSNLVSHRVYEEMDIYPNPTDNILMVRWPNNKEPVNLWLTNASGKRLKLLHQNNQIDLSNYVSGFYFLFVEIDGKYYRSKIIKN